MKNLSRPDELGSGAAALAIGVFDGVHLGHQEVIRRMVCLAHARQAAAVVATFDRHPNAIIAPDRTPPAIQTPSQRLRVFAELGADATWLIRFDAAFSRQTGEVFVREMVRGFGRVIAICVGSGFQFGHRRSGDVDLLRRLGAEQGFLVEAVEPLTVNGQAISSTRIREAIRDGDLSTAGRLLGRAYSLAGRVVRGDQLGRRIGFPTANLDLSGLVLPPNGVYAVRAAVGEAEFPGVMNIGRRPTVTDAEVLPRVEVHLLDAQLDLYDRELTVTPVARLRDEMRFASLAALQAQIGQDVIAARALLR